MKRPLAVAACLISALLSFVTAGPVLGQSSDTLDILKNLSPDQMDAISGALSGQGTGGLGGLGSGTSGTSNSRDRQNRTTNQQDERDQQDRDRTRSTDEEEDEQRDARFPTLKGDDSVIIEIDFHLPPRPVSQTLQAAYLAQGISPAAIAAMQQQSAASAAQTPQQQAAAAAALAAQGARPGAGQGAQAGAPGFTPDLTPAVPTEQLTEEEVDRLDRMMKLIRARNPYQLSHDGALTLPGFPPIPLLGLSDDDATLRLKSDSAFINLDIRLTRLPLKKSGPEALKPFGYDLFSRSPSTFAPVTNVPVPADYVIGPGDILEVQLFGSQNRNLRLPVGRDGRISFPELGPVVVGGQLFNNVRSTIEERVSRQMIGVRASVSMGDTRSIRVFVLGEANRPGSYTISGLGTITSALFAAGGVKRAGSLRDVQLKRQGKVERHLDLYDMLIRGDTTDDTKLLPGDVVFIPPVGPTVSVDGQVRRPAIYEIRNESTVADVIGLAGGLKPEADRSRMTVTRIDDNQHRVVLAVDSATAAGRSLSMSTGDLFQVPRLKQVIDSGVSIRGYVYTPGSVAWHQGLRLSEVIHSVDELQPNADIHYVLIRRELPPDRRVSVVSADLAEALRAPGSAADVVLMPRDQLTVFDLASGRDRTIQPLLDELRAQANQASPSLVVHVDGRVKVPGDYPLETGMKVADLVRAAGGLSDAAYSNSAELTRYEVIDGETRKTDLISVNLNAAERRDATANIALQPFDNLSVKEVSEWRGQESVTLRGEVRFPGHYSIRRGETLSAVIARAGGLTAYAFTEGAVFTRLELKRREQDQLDALTARMQKDLAILAVQSTATSTNGNGGAGALAVGQQLFTQLRSAKAVGRLVIDVNAAIHAKAGSAADVALRNGDELIIPRLQQEVMVLGEVQNTTSHLFNPGLSRDDYIAQSGGLTRRADRKSIYVVRANGSVIANQGSRWFDRSDVQIRPGDTVVVPLDAEHMPPLPYWQAVTSILYNVAIAVAAVHSL
ncbi:MAG TPA: SLBB domain-containing protein [Steroidobacteraceae bacterium]|jgi:protein involved in polysaccharide export with SLBB domain